MRTARPTHWIGVMRGRRGAWAPAAGRSPSCQELAGRTRLARILGGKLRATTARGGLGLARILATQCRAESGSASWASQATAAARSCACAPAPGGRGRLRGGRIQRRAAPRHALPRPQRRARRPDHPGLRPAAPARPRPAVPVAADRRFGEAAVAAACQTLKIVDVGGDHRFVDGWTYGLTEVTGPAAIAESSRASPTPAASRRPRCWRSRRWSARGLVEPTRHHRRRQDRHQRRRPRRRLDLRLRRSQRRRRGLQPVQARRTPPRCARPSRAWPAARTPRSSSRRT